MWSCLEKNTNEKKTIYLEMKIIFKIEKYNNKSRKSKKKSLYGFPQYI